MVDKLIHYGPIPMESPPKGTAASMPSAELSAQPGPIFIGKNEDVNRILSDLNAILLVLDSHDLAAAAVHISRAMDLLHLEIKQQSE